MDAILTPPTRLAETLGAKLRRLARDADHGNPTASLPWKVPPAYAQGEAVKPGHVRVSNGNWYVAISTATTAGASGPSHADADPRFDGASSTGALWGYLGPAPMASDDPGAPTIAFSTSSSLGNLIRPVSKPLAYRMLGASPATYDTIRWRPDVFEPKPGVIASGYGASVKFRIDEAAFEIEQVAGANPMAILVDGRFVTMDGSGVPASTTWIKVTMPGGRRPHLVEIRGDRRGWYFSGTRISTNGQIEAPPSEASVRAAFVEDSIGAGSTYGPFLCGQTLHRRFADLLGIDDLWSFSTGGTGYIAKGPDGTYYNYLERLQQVVAINPDIVFLAGSTNDRGTAPGTAFASTAIAAADITAAALATFRQLRTLGYRGPIVVFGVISVDDTTASADSKIAYVEQAIADAVTAFGDPLTWFIPVRNDPLGPWVTGSWNNSLLPASTNSGLITNTADKTHPGDLGTAHYARRRADAFRRVVLPRLR